ncbi:23S rRNA methyltransferase [Candidatus Peregrinibacteria bacterium]|nr:MAG: 23S rRNA methyltransferase [Candidatus Peregrinibacteria bacterium]
MPKKYIVQDAFFRRAKREGYRARSVYKLQEIQEKFKILKRKNSVLDLGSFPGSWIQYIQEMTHAPIYGVDLQEMKEIPGTTFFHGDATKKEFEDFLRSHNQTQFDVITSDMAPNTRGIFDVDQFASVELNLLALEIMKKFLKPNGWAVFKLFRGADFNEFWFEAKKLFPNLKTFKPKSTRERSFELFCIGRKQK